MDWWGKNDIKWDYLWKEFICSEQTFSKIRELGKDSIDDVNRAAIEWIVTMTIGQRQFEIHPEKILKVKYENLTRDTDNELNRIFKFCELSNDKLVYEYAKKRMFVNTPKKMPQLHPVIYQYFEKTMLDLGYSFEAHLEENIE